jgi:predicted ATPase
MADLAEVLLATLDLGESRLLERRLQVERPGLERLVDALADRCDLIVLDNCEHLIDAAANLADYLLTRCARLRMIATSREPLNIGGEVVYPVRPLALPDPADADDPAALLANPAVRLFVDRARAAHPGFVVDGASAGAIVRICQRLDGLPLALELAAARLRTLSVQQIAERLSDRFALLTGGSRAAMPRHRTLHAVVEWSWDLLDDDERATMESLAVFAGGISPDAAAAVCGERAGSLERLSDLADKSLLTSLDGDAPRFRMLETIREFGVERLLATGREGAAREAHAGYFVRLAAQAAPRLRTAEQVEWIERITLDRDNLFAALSHLAASRQAQQAIDMAVELAWCWTLTGAHALAASWIRIALDVPSDVAPQSWATAQLVYGINSAILGWTSMDTPEFLRAQRILAEQDPRQQDALGLMMRIMCALFASPEGQAALFADPDAADRAAATTGAEDIEELIDIAIGRDDRWLRAVAMMVRGAVAENGGEMADAVHWLGEALAIFESLGERWGIGNTLDALGRARMVTDGDMQGAIDALRRSRVAMDELGSQDDTAQNGCWMALALLRIGDIDGAERELRGAEAMFERGGGMHGPMLSRCIGAEIARARGDLASALRLCDAALAIGAANSTIPDQIVAMALSLRAAILATPGAQRDPAAARRAAAESLRRADRAHDMPVYATAGLVASLVLAAEGDLAASARALGAARVARGALDPTNPDSISVSRLLAAADPAAAPTVQEALEAGEALSRDEAVRELRELANRLVDVEPDL